MSILQGPTGWLFWANVVIWGGLACYAVFLAAAQSSLKKRARRLNLEGARHGDC